MSMADGEWYIELSPKIKQRFNEILQDEFGATPKVQTKAKTPVTEPAPKTSTNIQNQPQQKKIQLKE